MQPPARGRRRHEHRRRLLDVEPGARLRDFELAPDLDTLCRITWLDGTALCLADIMWLDQNGGSVINAASFVAVMGAATSQISYTASKGGVLALARAWRRVRPPRSTRQRAVPGAGRHAAAARAVRQGPERAARRLVHVPIGRLARAEEIASAALFLASDDRRT